MQTSDVKKETSGKEEGRAAAETKVHDKRVASQTKLVSSTVIINRNTQDRTLPANSIRWPERRSFIKLRIFIQHIQRFPDSADVANSGS